jgi:hypothetical protein
MLQVKESETGLLLVASSVSCHPYQGTDNHKQAAPPMPEFQLAGDESPPHESDWFKSCLCERQCDRPQYPPSLTATPPTLGSK